jgi:hypothetical protein
MTFLLLLLLKQGPASVIDESGYDSDHIPKRPIDLSAVWKKSYYEKESLEIKKLYYEEILLTNTTAEIPANTLLIGISTSVSDFNRRQLIRTHQINPYKKYNITFRFVLANPEPLWWDVINYENKTFNDLIVLGNINDTRDIANTIKQFEFFTYVEKNMGLFKFVAKLDSDCFVSITDFWKDFFNDTIQELDFAIIALFVRDIGKFSWPQGSFEVISWKVMLLLNRLYANVYRTRWDEDIQLAWYLFDAQLNYTQIDFTRDRAYDFNKGTHPYFMHDVGYKAVRIHELKTDKTYLAVASCFNINGVNKTRIDELRSSGW